MARKGESHLDLHPAHTSPPACAQEVVHGVATVHEDDDTCAGKLGVTPLPRRFNSSNPCSPEEHCTVSESTPRALKGTSAQAHMVVNHWMPVKDFGNQGVVNLPCRPSVWRQPCWFLRGGTGFLPTSHQEACREHAGSRNGAPAGSAAMSTFRLPAKPPSEASSV